MTESHLFWITEEQHICYSHTQCFRSMPRTGFMIPSGIYRASWIRTNALRNQNPLPYRLAMALLRVSDGI